MGVFTEVEAEIRRDYQERCNQPRHETIEAGRVRDYLLAMDEPADLAPGQPVPALFLLTLGRTRRPQPNRGSAVNAGNEYEFLGPVLVGDVVTSRFSILSIEEKQGKVGQMFLIRTETRFENQKGELVGRATGNTLRWGL